MSAQIQRTGLFVIGCVTSLLVISVALYSEAVDAAVAFDFNTPVTWREFRSSMPFVGIEHFNLKLHDVVALTGIIAMLLCAFLIRMGMPTWSLIGYSTVYFASGGFIGLIAISFGWFLVPVDGEFFQDSVANSLGHGVWGYMLIVLVIHRLAVRTKTAEQDAVDNP